MTDLSSMATCLLASVSFWVQYCIVWFAFVHLATTTMDHHPKFRFLARSTTLKLEPTAEANSVAAANNKKPVTPAKKAEEVEEEARRSVRDGQLTPEPILSASRLQFGQYKGAELQVASGERCWVCRRSQRKRPEGGTAGEGQSAGRQQVEALRIRLQLS